MTQIIAHRGASKAERENTVAAYRAAVAMGADMVEIDVRRTADGVLVIHHDPVFADGSMISDLTAAELPTHIPTLIDALDACEGVAVNVEVKNDPAEPGFDATGGFAAQVGAALLDYDRVHDGSPRRWLISSFDFDTVGQVGGAYPGVRRAFLRERPTKDDIEQAANAGFDAINPGDDAVTAPLARAAHQAGLLMNVYTVDDPTRMVELMGWGIDGIFTNVPDVGVRCRERPG